MENLQLLFCVIISQPFFFLCSKLKEKKRDNNNKMLVDTNGRTHLKKLILGFLRKHWVFANKQKSKKPLHKIRNTKKKMVFHQHSSTSSEPHNISLSWLFICFFGTLKFTEHFSDQTLEINLIFWVFFRSFLMDCINKMEFYLVKKYNTDFNLLDKSL